MEWLYNWDAPERERERVPTKNVMILVMTLPALPKLPRRCPARLATWHRQRSCETVRMCSRFSFLSFLCIGNRGYTAWANMYSLLKQHSGKQGGAYARQRHMARVQYIWPVSIVSTLDDLDLISQEVHLPSKGIIVSYHSMATIDLFQLPLPLPTVPLGFTSCCFQLHSCLQNSPNIKHTQHTFHLDSFDTFYNPTGASRYVKTIAVFFGWK